MDEQVETEFSQDRGNAGWDGSVLERHFKFPTFSGVQLALADSEKKLGVILDLSLPLAVFYVF